MRKKVYIWFARTRFGGWLGEIGYNLHKEHVRPILKEAFGEDFDQL